MARKTPQLIRRMRCLSLNVKTTSGMDPKRRGRKRRHPARSTRQSDPPTWGQLKKLVAQVQELVTAQRTSFTPMTMFLAMLAALSATAATAGIALSKSVNKAHFVNQLSKSTSVALALQSHMDSQLKTELDELKDVVLSLGDQINVLKIRMKLNCHAKYSWICVTAHKYNESDWDRERIKMHILSVWSDSKISLDIRKLNAEIQAIQESHLDESDPTEIIKRVG